MRANALPEEERNIHQSTALKDFISFADNPAVCGNCLDLPSLRYTCPDLIRLVLLAHPNIGLY
jgi:hypothetical protein